MEVQEKNEATAIVESIEKNESTEIVEQKELQLGAFESAESFQSLLNIGKMFATSEIVPASYRGKAMDCAIAVDMANRMKISPMMVMQNLYVVQGKPSWSGQACMALITASGKFKNVNHVYTGVKGSDEWGCYLEAIRTEDGELIRGTEITLKMAKDEGWYGKSGSKWKTMPEQMLAYRASSFFARVHVPNALMGVAVEGEIEDITKTERIETTDPFDNMQAIDEKIMIEAEELFK